MCIDEHTSTSISGKLPIYRYMWAMLQVLLICGLAPCWMAYLLNCPDPPEFCQTCKESNGPRGHQETPQTNNSNHYWLSRRAGFQDTCLAVINILTVLKPGQSEILCRVTGSMGGPRLTVLGTKVNCVYTSLCCNMSCVWLFAVPFSRKRYFVSEW